MIKYKKIKCFKEVLFLSILIISLILPAGLTLLAAHNSNISDDELAVKSVINDYFKTELEAVRGKEVESDIVIGTKMKHYQKVKCNFYNIWYKKMTLNLLSYNLFVKIDYMEFRGNDCTTQIDMGTDMIFNRNPNIVQKSRENKYKFTLYKGDGKWFINSYRDLQHDNYDIDTETRIIEENIKNIDSIAKKFMPLQDKPLENNQLIVSSSFSRNAAVEYAHTYCESPNSNFPYFDGADCTNFVSQAWNAAGISMTDYWYCYSSKNYTKSWTCVKDFRNYMIGNGWCYESNDKAKVQLADGIQLYNSLAKDWLHTVITTKIGNGTLYYTAHTNPRYDYDIANVYPSSTWTNIRYLCVYNFG